jgi:hypothetical protein
MYFARILPEPDIDAARRPILFALLSAAGRGAVLEDDRSERGVSLRLKSCDRNVANERPAACAPIICGAIVRARASHGRRARFAPPFT